MKKVLTWEDRDACCVRESAGLICRNTKPRARTSADLWSASLNRRHTEFYQSVSDCRMIFVQLLFGRAAAEGECAGEMFPVVERQAVKFASESLAQRGPFLQSRGFFKSLSPAAASCLRATAFQSGAGSSGIETR